MSAVVREQRGPYSDPQHPYFYEEEDVWMAPGFTNQFYEVRLIGKIYTDLILYLVSLSFPLAVLHGYIDNSLLCILIYLETNFTISCVQLIRPQLEEINQQMQDKVIVLCFIK